MNFMKTVIAVLSLMSLSSLGFAGVCNSKNLGQAQERLASLQGLSTEEKAILLNGMELVKESEILTCAGLGLNISPEEASFAISSIEKDRTSKLFEIKKSQQRLLLLLQDETVSVADRSWYSQGLSLIPKRISQVNEHADTLVTQLVRATR